MPIVDYTNSHNACRSFKAAIVQLSPGLLDFKLSQLMEEVVIVIELHNYVWEEVRLVQVETQLHHIAGVLTEVRDTLENSDCEWQDIYSAYYECEEDGTVPSTRVKVRKQVIQVFGLICLTIVLLVKKKQWLT